jgi:hypothetical protein
LRNPTVIRFIILRMFTQGTLGGYEHRFSSEDIIPRCASLRRAY